MSDQAYIIKVYESCCYNCLLSKNAIVSPERIEQIINDCKENGNYFICHKSSMQEPSFDMRHEVCCSKFYHLHGKENKGKLCLAIEFDLVKFVEQPDNKKLTPYHKFSKNES